MTFSVSNLKDFDMSAKCLEVFQKNVSGTSIKCKKDIYENVIKDVSSPEMALIGR